MVLRSHTCIIITVTKTVSTDHVCKLSDVGILKATAEYVVPFNFQGAGENFESDNNFYVAMWWRLASLG